MVEAELAGLTRGEIVEALRAATRRKRRGGALGKGPITMAEVAASAGWPTHRARRYMTRLGIAYKQAGRWYVTPQRLRSADPNFWLELELHAAGR